ncbi:MAG: type II toxin-antitoxin system ParD family antitoxin [Phycisphaerales bacterium]|nr:type II toxin-antitoxin system ParD family antitoxin [Phycisphaerales bacterium]
MNVSLTQELETMVKDKVQSGMYHSASEVIRAGLRLLKDQDQLYAIRLAELRKEVAIGVEQADRGQTAPLDMQAIKAKARSRKVTQA